MVIVISVATSALGVITRVANKVRNDGLSGLISGVRANLLRKAFFRRFHWWERRGVHVTPVQPWSPIPDTRTLDRGQWPDSTGLSGIEVREEAQLDFLATCRRKYDEAYTEFPAARAGVVTPDQYYIQNGTFETVDGEIFYCMVREHAPEQVLQIGGGFSTRVLAQAIEDGSLDCTVEVFEPYRDDWLNEASSEAFTLTGEWADRVDADRFDRLAAGDIVFVDSSHVLRTGNDVYTLLFEVIPRLPNGVLVHFHDIFLPNEYPREWIVERAWFLNEQYAVQAFLEFNDGVDVRWMSGYMHDNHPEALADAFESYDPSRVGEDDEMHVPNSLWLEING